MGKRIRPGAAVLAALCGIAIGVGALFRWVAAHGSRPATGITHTALSGLAHWRYHNTSPFLQSFGAVVVLTGILVLVTGLIGWRVATGFFSVLALGAAGTWIGLNAYHYRASARCPPTTCGSAPG
jgi:hypothetical protein